MMRPAAFSFIQFDALKTCISVKLGRFRRDKNENAVSVLCDSLQSLHDMLVVDLL